MNCNMVRTRLVALSDDELAPSERQHVLDHLDTCETCLERSFKLQAATPMAPEIDLPYNARHAMHMALDRALEEAALQPTPPVGRTSWQSTKTGAIAVAAAAVLFVLGWGATALTQQVDDVAHLDTAPPDTSHVVPLDAYRPAAYTPEDGWF